jgi:hypothetical protein
MHWRDKGERDRPKLATSSKDVNGKTPNTIVYADFEAAFLTWLDELDWGALSTPPIRKRLKHSKRRSARSI